MAALSPRPSGQHLERGLTLDRRKSITFTGKLFYLDLPHNKQTQLLTRAICSLGGVIEGFLSRDVNYVVTGNKKAADIANGNSNDKKGGSSQRPATEKMEKTPYSRGKQLLKKVVQSQECSSILSSARSWGVCILHVDEVLEYLECSTQRRAKRPAEGKGPGGLGKILKVGKLKSPFLKIEDQSRKYRPIHCSFSNFPECSFISSDRSPFETARTHNSTHKERDPGEQDKEGEGERPQNWEKSGYCECCQMTYTKLSEHLISEQHCLFALDASNYKVIDDIASRIVCDLVPLPNGFKPSEEQCEDETPLQSLAEPTEEREIREGESKEQPVDQSVELPTEKPNLEEQDAACPIDSHSPALANDPPLVNLVMDPTQEYAGGLPENLLVEDCGSQCTVSTNALVHCDLPLDPCEAGEASHVGLVTEVSWYTEDTGLTSVYTVQSLVLPPAHGLDQHPVLALEHASVQPPLFLSALGDPLQSLAQGGFSGSSDEPVHKDTITTAHIEPQIINAAPHQTNESLADEPQAMASAGDCAESSATPAIGSECTLHCLDTSVTVAEVPFVESAVEQSQCVLLVSSQDKLVANPPCELQMELSNSLHLDQLTLAPWHPSVDGTVTVPPSTEPLADLVDSQDPEPAVPNTDWGKRKHCWSPCHPPAKRQPLHCQPMPMWVFHQLPSSMNQPTIPVFSDCSDRSPKGEGAPPTLCFNPKLAQYEASSESDWDSQLASQCHKNSQQTAHLGELRTAQVSLDESWYGKQLCSVLAHEQTLGSPSTTQNVTLSHSSYDIYLSGAVS